MRPLNDHIIPTQTAATITTAAVPAAQLLQVAAQLTATGAAAGTLQLQCSLDNTMTPSVAPVNWSNVPSASVAVSGAGVYLIPKTDVCYNYVRLVYTNTGSGTVSVVLQAIGE